MNGRTSYPVFMISISIIGDVLKGLLLLIPITMPVGLVFGFLLSALFYIWAFTMGGFSSIKDSKKRNEIMSKVLKRSALRMCAGLVPLVSLIPWTAIAVHSVWKDVNGK